MKCRPTLDSTFWTDLGYTARRNFRKREEYTNWLGQLHDVPRYFHEQMNEMRAGAARGFTPPAITMVGRDASITAVIEATPEGSFFYIPFKDMSGFASAEEAQHLRAAGRRSRRFARWCSPRTLSFLSSCAASICRACEPHSQRKTCRTAKRSTARESASSRPSIWIQRPSTHWERRKSRACTARC